MDKLVHCLICKYQWYLLSSVEYEQCFLLAKWCILKSSKYIDTGKSIRSRSRRWSTICMLKLWVTHTKRLPYCIDICWSVWIHFIWKCTQLVSAIISSYSKNNIHSTTGAGTIVSYENNFKNYFCPGKDELISWKWMTTSFEDINCTNGHISFSSIAFSRATTATDGFFKPYSSTDQNNL